MLLSCPWQRTIHPKKGKCNSTRCNAPVEKNPVGTRTICNLNEKLLFHKCTSFQDLRIWRIAECKCTFCCFLFTCRIHTIGVKTTDVFVQLAYQLSQHWSLIQPTIQQDWLHSHPKKTNQTLFSRFSQTIKSNLTLMTKADLIANYQLAQNLEAKAATKR